MSSNKHLDIFKDDFAPPGTPHKEDSPEDIINQEQAYIEGRLEKIDGPESFDRAVEKKMKKLAQ